MLYAITHVTGRRLAACREDAAAELLADPAVTKIRECEADGCGCSSWPPIRAAAGARPPAAATGCASPATISATRPHSPNAPRIPAIPATLLSVEPTEVASS
jgi:hypothetical protein